MRSRKCLKPSFARAQLWLLAGFLIVAGLLPHSAASRDNPGRSAPESTAVEAHGTGMASPQGNGSDPAPIVTGITPDSGANNGIVHIADLSGSYFQSGASVKLTKSGQPDVPGSDVSVVSSSTITCTIDLTGVVTGTWDVVVTNLDTQSGVLTEGFTVRSPSHVYLPSVIRYWPRIDSLHPIADATIVERFPTINLGNTRDMWIGYDHCGQAYAQITRSLLRFDTSGIPPGANILEATLHLYLVNSCDLGPRTHQATVYRLGDSWSEMSVNWYNQPGYAEAYGSASISSVDWGWHSFDVANLVRGWVNGSVANHGLMVRGPESSGNDSARLGFATREWLGIEKDPYLRVTYMDNSGAVSELEGSIGVTSPESAYQGRTTRDLLGSISRSSTPAAPGFVEWAEGATD